MPPELAAIDSFVDTLNHFSPWVDIPNIGPVFGHEDAYFVGNVAGTVAGMAAGMSVGNIAAGTSSLVACGSLAQKAAKLYTAIDTVAGIASATSNIAAGNASLGDALAFLPVMTVGVQKLRGAPTNCFIAGTLVAVAGVGVGTADAGPSTASKPIEEIQVGDFVWARDEHDPSAPAKLEKVVALYRSTSYDLQQLEVLDAAGQSEQIVATDGHPFFVVDVGWTTADAIQVGQKLVGAGGAVLTVVANRDWKPEGGVVVYNFQVEGDHTYFVGDIHAQGEWVWTHNACTFDGINGKLNREASDQLRDNARNIWQQLTGRRPIWDDLEVHHRVPLEWSHILPKADPNRVSNLVGVDGQIHKQVTRLWGDWKRSLGGREPSQSEIIKHALSIDTQFANHWIFPR